MQLKKSKMGAPTQRGQFVNEVIILSQVKNRNVVRLLGCCFERSVPLFYANHSPRCESNKCTEMTITQQVSDCGASRLVALDHTQITSLVQGTLGYLFPSNQLTEKSDVYSFGVVLVELLTSKVALSFARPEAERNLASFFVCSVEEGHLSQ